MLVGVCRRAGSNPDLLDRPRGAGIPARDGRGRRDVRRAGTRRREPTDRDGDCRSQEYRSLDRKEGADGGPGSKSGLLQGTHEDPCSAPSCDGEQARECRSARRQKKALVQDHQPGAALRKGRFCAGRASRPAWDVPGEAGEQRWADEGDGEPPAQPLARQGSDRLRPGLRRDPGPRCPRRLRLARVARGGGTRRTSRRRGAPGSRDRYPFRHPGDGREGREG